MRPGVSPPLPQHAPERARAAGFSVQRWNTRGELSPELRERFAWRILLGKDRSVNAFALPGGYLGVHLGLIAVVTSRDELASVMAHELSHVSNRDILISSIAATLAGVLVMIANTLRWGAMFGGYSRDDRENGGNPIGLIAISIIARLSFGVNESSVSKFRMMESRSSSGNGGTPALSSSPRTKSRCSRGNRQIGRAHV